MHQRDNDKLLKTLKNLRDLGNTLIVVEHDEDTMLEADWIVDIGPGAGEHGGYLVAEGTAQDIMKCEKSVTGAYLSGRIRIPVPSQRRQPTGFLHIIGAAENNLKHINVDNTVTGTGFTPSTLHVKAETSFLVTSLFGIYR